MKNSLSSCKRAKNMNAKSSTLNSAARLILTKTGAGLILNNCELLCTFLVIIWNKCGATRQEERRERKVCMVGLKFLLFVNVEKR